MIRKNILLSIPMLLLLAVIISCSQSGSGEYDSRAIQKLDDLVETIGNLESCSFTLDVRKTQADSSKAMDTMYVEHDIYLRGPNKMYIYSKHADHNMAYWYDGDSLSYFSFTKSKYKSYKAADNILATIDAIHENYGIEFPAADFFYPTLTDDIIANYDHVLYLGEVEHEDETYVHIEASNEQEILSLWISSATHLPGQMRIENGTKGYYEGRFSNWRLDPELNDEMFLFTPPPGSEKAQ